jgi:hypothetical protein
MHSEKGKENEPTNNAMICLEETIGTISVVNRFIKRDEYKRYQQVPKFSFHWFHLGSE